MDEAEKRKLILSFVITVAVALFCGFVIKTPEHRPDPGTGLRLLAGIVAIPTGFIGLLIGDFLRRAVMPDAIFTTGGFFGLLKARLFWGIGPQAIGLFIGVAIGASIVL